MRRGLFGKFQTVLCEIVTLCFLHKYFFWIIRGHKFEDRVIEVHGIFQVTIPFKIFKNEDRNI